MKKIININLSGRVIPIEDAAYESLQRYIESLRRYFANEEGRDEIINDIESRIAELMNDKVKKGAPAVTEADMEEILSAMGRIEDFEEVDSADSSSQTQASSAKGGRTGSQPFADLKLPRGRLFRDSVDKKIGGVCAGLANYINIDPAIVRILFLILTFAAGMSIWVYLILWIIVPPRRMEPVKAKRLFRNPDERIIGGVAGGIGAYLNKDAWTIRLIFAAPLVLNMLIWILRTALSAFHDGEMFPDFILGSFTFTFVMTYIVLWIILPQARNTYQKMEMRGENVDVNRIRQTVQNEMESFKAQAQAVGAEVKETAQAWTREAQEFAGTRGKAFASEVRQTASTGAHGIGYVIGVLAKSFLLFIAGCFAVMFFFMVMFVIFGGVGELVNHFLLESPSQHFLGWASFLLVFGVPAVAFITWLIRRIMKVRSHNRYLGLVFGGLWTLGIFCTAFFIGSMVRSFRFYQKLPVEVAVTQPRNKMIVAVNGPEIQYSGTYAFINSDENGWDITPDSLLLSNVKLQIEKSDDSLYHVTVWRYAAGSSRAAAAARAQVITYAVTSTDSLLNLAAGYAVSRHEKFRDQKILVAIEVPVGKYIHFDESINERLNMWSVHIRENRNRFRNHRDWDLDWDDNSYYDWKPGIDYLMTANGDLLDTTQPLQRNEKGVYEYRPTSRDSLQRIIDEKERSLEEDRRKLEQGTDANDDDDQPAQKDTPAPKVKKPAGRQATAQIPSPVFPVTI